MATLQAGDAAKRLGVTTQTIRNWASSGRLRSERTSTGTFLFDEADVERFRSGEAPVELEQPGIMVRETAWSGFDGHDGREVGGWLVGYDHGDRLVVEKAIEDDEAQRSSGTISLDLRRAMDVASGLPAGMKVLGDWHCHVTEGSRQASSTDRVTWARTAAAVGRRWLGVVVSEPETGYGDLKREWYLTTPDGEVRWTAAVPLRSRSLDRTR